MSTSSLRLCVWRRGATDRTWVFFSQLDNGRCGSILGKMSHTSLRRGEARPGLSLPLSPYSLSVILHCYCPFLCHISLSLSSGCVRQRCLLILELGPFFASVPAAAATASACVLPLDLLPFETHLAALAHP